MVDNGSQALFNRPTPVALHIRHKYLCNLGFHPPNMTCSPSTWLVSQQPTATLAVNAAAQQDMMADCEVEENAGGLSTDTGSCGSSSSTDETGSDSDTAEVQKDSPPDNRNHDFRTHFLKKLAYSGRWLPEPNRPLKSQTIVIFDWDDTLVCTSFLERYDGISLPRVVKQHMSRVASGVKKILELACRLGQPFIITNAQEGWVEQSAALWIPEVIPVLKQIVVISARSTYEPCFPDDVSQWKRQAFLALQRQFDQHALTNLVAIGDSAFEMDAAHAMGDRFARAVVKTVKLQPQPRPQDLLAELGLLFGRLEHIVENGRPLQIRIDRRV